MARIKNKTREDGRVKSKVYLGDGKYKYVYARNNKELEKKVSEIKAQLGKGIDISAQRDTFKEWADRWLRIKKIEISDKKYKSYESRLKRFNHIHNIEIAKIRTSDIQEVIIDNIELAEYTLTSIKNIASQIFDLAITNRVLEFNPAKAVKIPKKPIDKERRALTDEEQRWITDTPHRAQTAAMIMMYGGLRRGEMIPLLWTDIDLENATIVVNKSVETVDKKLVVKNSTKSDSGMRTVYIPQVLVNYLKNIEKSNNLLITTSAKGKMHTDNTWRQMWDSYLYDLNYKYGDFDSIIGFIKKKKGAPQETPFIIPKITPHWLRHTFITMMYLAGVDVMTAMQQAGHADIKTTMSIYTHLDGIYKAKQAQKLNDYINKKTAK